MRTVSEKLQALDSNSVWVFTKQDTDFDDAYKAALLFSEIKDKNNVNIENYFAQNHKRYGIETDRHRILVISQMLGLMTKTPYYVRGGSYNNEKPTAVFDAMKSAQTNSNEFNTLKTEQLLKLKIHAIIDTAHNNEDYNILPIVFIYSVLKKLKDEHSINEVSIDRLYTFIMTCKSYDEVDEAVAHIVEHTKNGSPALTFVDDYKSRSRVLSCIKKNTNLFIVSRNSISINPDFDEYFYQNFMLKYDIDDINSRLERDVDYAYYLNNVQDYGINLIDVPNATAITKPATPAAPPTYEEDEDDGLYQKAIDNIKLENINEDVGKNAYSVTPVITSDGKSGKRYKKNPLLGKIAIEKSNYCCELDHNHQSFIANKTNKSYMEAHHLVPIFTQEEMWKKYNINVDCVENLVSLCPTCHKAIHYGTKDTREQLINSLFAKCEPKYKSIGFNITLKELKKLYKI